MGKTCFKCGEAKPLSDFYKHPDMADGRANKCKECAKADVRNNRAAKRKYYADYDSKRGKTNKRREQNRMSRARQYDRNPHKKIARNLVRSAMKDGRLSRPELCEMCKTSNYRIEAHHHDYHKPLEVEWLCFKCHREVRHGEVVVSDTFRTQGDSC